MIKPLLTVFLCLFNLLCLAQQKGNPKKDEKSISQIKFLTIQYNINDFAREGFLKFDSIIVKDMRFDTTNIGTWFRYSIGGFNQNRKINYENGLRQLLQSCLNKSLSSETDGVNLYCFVKQFFLFKKDSTQENSSYKENFATLKVNIECYYEKNGNLYPALKIDTSFTDVLNISKKNIGESINTTITLAFFNTLYQKINNTDAKRVFEKKPMEYSSVNNYYVSRFSLPILKNENHQRGVYLNFTEFKNDAPSIKHIRIKPEDQNSISLFDSTR